LEALKILRADLSADDEYRQRFHREADLAAALWHPHIVGVHDRGEFDGQLWIAMDYVDGTDIAALLAQRPPGGLPPEQVAAIVTAVGGALDHAHHRGLLHRDVKPANIILSRPDDGSEPRILLSDFGIARPVDDTSGLTVTNMTIGTVDYCAPEQLLGGPLDGRADQYALATTAYHLLTGATLFCHINPVAVISAHLTTAPPLPGREHPDLAGSDPVFARALAKNPTERFARCCDFAAALAGQLLAAPAAPAAHTAPDPHTAPTAPAATPVAGPTGPAPSMATPLTAPAPPTAPVPPTAPAPASRPAPPPSAPTPEQAVSAGPQRKPKRRVVRLLSVLAAAAVLAGLGGLAATKIAARIAADRAAQDREAARLAGQHYLEALAAGDARTALALGAQQPATAQLDTDKALRAQLVGTPITDIVVTRDPGQDPAATPDAQRLLLAATFGTTPSKTLMWVRKKNGQWKLDTTTITVVIDAPPGSAEAMKTVAISGVGTDGASPVSVFPGTLQIASTNHYIDITAASTPLLLEALTDTAARPSSVRPAITLNDAGRQASVAAVDARVHYCFNGAPLTAECCPHDACHAPTVPVPGGSNAGIDRNTVRVVALENTQDATYELDPNLMRVRFRATLNYQAEGQRFSQPTRFRQILFVDAVVDLTKQPPVYLPPPN
jgi:hypothetical protein